jgi:hypothetical protein
MLDKSSHNHRSRKRSSSQPCPIYRRRYDCETLHYSCVHPWLPPVHFCIGASRWAISEHPEARDCARGDGYRGSRYDFSIFPVKRVGEKDAIYRERWLRYILGSWRAGL